MSRSVPFSAYAAHGVVWCGVVCVCVCVPQTSLEVQYGVRGVGMKYDRSMFGMKITDAMSLSKCCRATESLTTLTLPCCMIDDDLVRMLMTGLIRNQTVTYLDLSHNSITNYGAAARLCALCHGVCE